MEDCIQAFVSNPFVKLKNYFQAQYPKTFYA